MSKELYIAEMERLMSKGMSYEKAGERAYANLPDIYADLIDNAKQRAKDEGNWAPKETK